MTRAKNTGNILMKNMMDFCIGTPCFWLVGFGVMFAGSGALIGGFDPFIQGSYDFGSLPLWVYVVFQTVFCATAATIVSGSMAERTKFSAYCVYSAAISLIVYPISGHWIWGGGWLSQLGFHDFAGSTAVHFVGGVTACLGAWMLGPRIGKYGKDGKARAIPGHNLTAMALGVFILWFCWFGFNGGSTVSMTGDDSVFVLCRCTALRDIPAILPISPSVSSNAQYRIKMLCSCSGRLAKASATSSSRICRSQPKTVNTMLSLGYSSNVQSLSISYCDKALNSVSRFRWRHKSRR